MSQHRRTTCTLALISGEPREDHRQDPLGSGRVPVRDLDRPGRADQQGQQLRHGDVGADRLRRLKVVAIARWTGESGDPARALRLFQELLADQVRALGPDHPDTLDTRNIIAT
jgi:hypothetical protein